MCYLARHQQAVPGDVPADTPTPSGQHRPRWAGAATAVAVAGLALAAFLLPPAAPPVSADEAQGVVSTVASTFAPVPVVEQISISTTLDDGTPAPEEGTKAAGDACGHGM